MTAQDAEFFDPADDPEGQGYGPEPDEEIEREADEVFGSSSTNAASSANAASSTSAASTPSPAPQQVAKPKPRAARPQAAASQQPAPQAAAPAQPAQPQTPAPVAPAPQQQQMQQQPAQQQTQELATQSAQAPAVPRPQLKMGERGFDIENLDELWRLAQVFSRSTLVPKAYQGKPDNVTVAMMWGRELGLSPMNSLTGIAVINDTPSLWGDALPGLCYSAKDANGLPLLEDHHEYWDGEGRKRVAVCRVKRRGQKDYLEVRFGYEDAERAGLLNKQTYKAYPDRMYMNRARAFAFRTKFPDVLRGLAVAEEVEDYPASMQNETAPNAVASPKFNVLAEEGQA